MGDKREAGRAIGEQRAQRDGLCHVSVSVTVSRNLISCNRRSWLHPRGKFLAGGCNLVTETIDGATTGDSARLWTWQWTARKRSCRPGYFRCGAKWYVLFWLVNGFT